MSSRYRRVVIRPPRLTGRTKIHLSNVWGTFHKIHTPPDFNWNFHGKQTTTFPTISPSAPNVNFPLFLPERNIHERRNRISASRQRTKGKISSNKEAEWVYREYIEAVCFFNRESLAISPAGQKFSRNSIVLKYAEVNVAVD